MSGTSLLLPPVAFAVILFAVVAFSGALSMLALKTKRAAEGLAAYACGEDIPSHMMQPDYSQFFPFAFFFTILHVAALMVITVPAATTATFVIAVVYIMGAVVASSVLYGK
jgi:NADH:ubiquinone oxidoreductase subunit 3 (subunit A)